jgi:hypothetical protein
LYSFTVEPVSKPVTVNVGVLLFVYVVSPFVTPPLKDTSGASGAVVSNVKVRGVPAELVPCFDPAAIVTLAVKL